MEIRILLVDDHRILREGLRSLLDAEDDIIVAGEADDGASAILKARELKPDVIVMDVQMAGVSGIDATRKILEELPEVKIVALSVYARDHFVSEMLKAGASGYVLKEQAFTELIEAIKTVVSGQVYLGAKTASTLVDGFVRQGKKATVGLANLTEREMQILKLLAEGKPSKEIALIIDMSIQTVDGCRRNIMHKLNLKSTAEIVKFAIREGLTSVEF